MRSLTHRGQTDTIALAMKPVLSKILLFLWLAMLAGCSAPPKAPVIKLKDLAPIDAEQRGMMAPAAVNLKVVTFVVPAAEYNDVIQQVLAGLDRGEGIPKSPADFSANGFVAATGSLAGADKSIAIISRSKARLLNTSYFTFNDEKGYNVTMATLAAEASMPYVDNGTKKNLPLKPGRLVLHITVKRLATWASVFKLTVQPAWRSQYEDSFIERTMGVSGDLLFKTTAIETDMQAGEMVLFAPAKFDPDTPDMANIFMATSGNRPQVKITILMCTGINQ
jgi:hypothetical protein